MTLQEQFQPERGVRGTILETPRSVKEGGEEVFQVVQIVLKTMVRQAVPLHPMEVNGGANIYLEDITVEQVDA